MHEHLRVLPDLVDRVAPSVVHITTEHGTGSGFAVDARGYVVTNAHVVERSDRPRVKFTVGQELEAVIAGIDLSTDLAVLTVDHDALNALEFRELKTVRVGEGVIAVGSPIGLEWSVTVGIVSAKDRSRPAPDGRQIQHMIQTDAAVNPGNSGGPLVGLDGRVIGVNSQGMGPASMGLNFAVPSDTVQQVYDEVINHGSVQRGAIGAKARLEPFFGDEAERWGQPGGAALTEVVEDRPLAPGLS